MYILTKDFVLLYNFQLYEFVDCFTFDLISLTRQHISTHLSIIILSTLNQQTFLYKWCGISLPK